MVRTHTKLPGSEDGASGDEGGAPSSESAEGSVELPQPSGRDRVGTVVDDRYRIVDVIGVGGMGVVYRAEHVYIRRTVALKILDRDMANMPQLSERFEREALAIGRLDHPNCVSVLDFGHLPDGAFYLTMPYLEGPSLGDVMHDGERLDVRRALHIARHVASALAHIHNAGIVHRDVKPENIVIVDREGDRDFATLLDFGIAKLFPREDELDEDDPSQLTIAGQRFGTPAYMSPEQAIGAPLDARADLYSLCIVLYEMLCGARPYEHDDPVRLMEMQERARIPPMSDFGGAVPAGVEALVRRGLAKDARDRYADAVELIAAIDACLEALSKGRRDPRPFYRRPRLLAAATISLVLGFAASATVLLWPSGPGESPAAARARALLGQGKAIQAIAYLEGNPALAEHPDASLQLAHAYAASNRPLDAIASYRRALAGDDDFARDDDLIHNLRLMVDAGDVEAAASAADLLLSEVDDEATESRVVAMASEHDALARRTRMRQVAEQHGLAERIDWRASYTLDLAQAERCGTRRHAVARLRSIGDASAVPALERARDRPDNACLRENAEEAIAFLRGRAPKTSEESESAPE